MLLLATRTRGDVDVVSFSDTVNFGSGRSGREKKRFSCTL